MPSDRIILEGMQFYGFHGVNPEERRLGRPFTVDLEAELRLTRPGRTDRLSDTVSYTDLYRATKEILEGEPMNLLEAVAYRIVTTLLEQHPAIDAVRVRIRKPRPPIKGSIIESAAVEMYRHR